MLADDPPGSPPDVDSWVNAAYAPLPSLVTAARRIFEHEPLPQIRRAASAGIPQALEALQRFASVARERNERHIALVTGVPGAGKTLVGLQFVYRTRFATNEADRPAVFLSGNGPLVDVLQHALKSRIFVQDVHGFLMQYGGDARKLPEEHIWVYDEAQRAWDAERANAKRGHDLSEHEDFLNLGMKMPNWSMLVGLICQGQEIHLGEEGGLELWNDAIDKTKGKWVIHCPQRIAHFFKNQNVVVDDALDLTATLRSHVAADVHDWVRLLLEGKIDEASRLASKMQGSAFNLYVTRNLDIAKSYVRSRYSEEIDKRYGLLASSKSKNLKQFGVDATFQATRRFRPGPWYNDLPESPHSCCQLREVATEFSCQGLELDFPIVGWDTDLSWSGSDWVSAISSRSKAKNPHQLRVNSYRVLLTRGRDGMVMFVPPLESLDATHNAIKAAGVEELHLRVMM